MVSSSFSQTITVVSLEIRERATLISYRDLILTVLALRLSSSIVRKTNRKSGIALPKDKLLRRVTTRIKKNEPRMTDDTSGRSADDHQWEAEPDHQPRQKGHSRHWRGLRTVQRGIDPTHSKI
jgi:hypothetical protein